MASECCLAKASTSALTVRVCTVVKRIGAPGAASDSTMVLPQVPSPTTAALIRRLSLFGPIHFGQVSSASAMQLKLQNAQYSMPPITQIHFLVTFQVAAPATNRWKAAISATYGV